MNAQMIQNLATHAADVAATSGEAVARVEMGEMADGSGRFFALVYTQDERNYRVSSPAPLDCPDWAAHYDEWIVEASGGPDGWFALDADD